MRPKVGPIATKMSAVAQVARAAAREDRKQAAEAASAGPPPLTFDDFEHAPPPPEEDDEDDIQPVTVFVCGPRRALCSVCGVDAPHRCDHKVDAAGRSCGAQLCGKHRRKVGDYNLCPPHFPEHARTGGAMKYGPAIRALRRARGLSQGDVAAACDISSNYVSMLEKGRSTPSLDTIGKLSAAFSVPVYVFFFLASEEVDLALSPAKLTTALRRAFAEFIPPTERS